MENNINIKVYHDVDEFLDSVKSFDVSYNPYLSYAFLSVFLKYFKADKYFFFNIYEDSKLIAIVPFECTFESCLLNVKKFRFIGYRQFNYEQYICEDKDMAKVHKVFIEYLEVQKYSVILNIYDINNASPFYKVLQEDLHQKKELQLYGCPCLHFMDNFEDFFKSVYTSSKKRSELKKFQKKVTELGKFKLVNIENKKEYDENIHYINQIYKVHAERFAGVYATSFFGSEKMRPYYSELIKSLMYGERGHISLMVLDEVVIAFVFCLTNGTVLIDWIPAFDPAFSRYSLGIVQYKMLFEEICNQGKYEIFDYSKGLSVYKSKWAKDVTYNYQLVMNLSRSNPFAHLLYAIDKVKFSFKVYLRQKGVLKWAKFKIGEFLAWKNKGKEQVSSLKVTILENYDGEDYKLDYSEINNYPVETREAVLSALYQGKRVIKVLENEVVLA